MTPHTEQSGIQRPTDDAPLNIEEAAHRLGVSVRYMRRIVDEKRVRYLKVGRLVRFRGADLEAYLKQAEVEPRQIDSSK
jgi:excisionase family DNA binding protein